MWAYFLALSGMYLARWFKPLVIITNVFAAAVAIHYFKPNSFEGILTSLFFLFLIVIPYSYHARADFEKKKHSVNNSLVKEKYKAISEQNLLSKFERQQKEKDIERIMSFYFMSKSILKNIYPQHHERLLSKAFVSTAGVLSVSVFSVKPEGWDFSESTSSDEKFLSGLKDFMSNDNILIKETSCVAFEVEKLRNSKNALVFWPLRIENELLGAIVLECKKGYEDIYIREGAIFTPQIALSTKKIKLFKEIDEKLRNDGLTGIYRRNYFMKRMEEEIQREQRYKAGFYILMADLDFFKNVNDKYGHIVGDIVLREIARIFSQHLRPGDLLGRYGGEEFIAFIPAAKESEVLNIAEKIRKAVANKEFEENGEKFSITVSIGICGYQGEGATFEKIINFADTALYRAKESGRNQVIMLQC